MKDVVKIPTEKNIDIFWKKHQKEISTAWLSFTGFSFFFLLTHPLTFVVLISISVISGIYLILYYRKKPEVKTHFILNIAWNVNGKGKNSNELIQVTNDEKNSLVLQNSEIEVIDLQDLSKKKFQIPNSLRSYEPGKLIQLMVSPKTEKVIGFYNEEDHPHFFGILPALGKKLHYQSLKHYNHSKNIDSIANPTEVFFYLMNDFIFENISIEKEWNKWISNKIFSPNQINKAFCLTCEKRPELNAMGIFSWCQCPTCGNDAQLISKEKIIGFFGEKPGNLNQYHFVNLNEKIIKIEAIWCWKSPKLDESISKYLLYCQNNHLEIPKTWHFSSYDPPHENSIRMIKEQNPQVEIVYGFTNDMN